MPPKIIEQIARDVSAGIPTNLKKYKKTTKQQAQNSYHRR
jgi:hypothetical protein